MIPPTRVNNFRRVYRLTRWFRQRFTPPGQFIVLVILVSGILGIDTSRTLSYQIFSGLAALVLFAIICAAFNRSRFRCERILPQVATVGQPVRYRVSITNQTTSLQSDLLLIEKLEDHFPSKQELQQFRDSESQHDNWFDHIVGYPRWVRLATIKAGAYAPMQAVPRAPGKQKVDLQLTLTPLRRGYLRFTGMTLGCPDPIGLIRAFSKNDAHNSLLVLPRRYPLPDLKLPGRRHHHQGGVALASSVGETSEFQGLRDYQPGDPLRRVHWRSWARTGKPVVKTYEDEFFVRHALILDTYAQGASSQQFEEAVSVAASIALNINDQESLLDLMFVERRAYRFTAGRGVGDIQSILEILACVKPEQGYFIEVLTNLVMAHSAQLCTAICVLLNWDEPRKALVKALRELGVYVVVLIVGNENQMQTDLGPMADQPQQLQWLPSGDVESGLAKLAQLQGAQ